ncbi:MAG: tetratricopeptide repeat protein [Myxococcota bacterium]
MPSRPLPILIASLAGCAGATPLPPEAVEHNAAGAEALAGGRLDDAEARFRLALEYHPQFTEPRANLGLVALERGDLPAAESHLRGAIELNGDFAEAWANLGVVLERRGRDDGAREAYERALSIQPGLVPARRNLARLLVRTGRLGAARAHLMRLVQIEPSDLAARALLAHVELRLGRPAAAQVRAAAVLDEEPGHPVALLVRGVARAHRGDLDGAVRDLQRLSDDPVVGRHARLRLAAVHALRGERDRARTLLAPLVAETPDDPAVQLVACRVGPDRRRCPDLP